MKAPLSPARRTLRRVVWGALVLVLAGLLLVPYLRQLLRTPMGLGFFAALAGYLVRRSWRDAAFLAIPIAGAEAVEMGMGPQLMAFAVLPVFAVTARARFAAAAGVLLLTLLLTCIRMKERFAGTLLTCQDVQFFFLRFADNVGVMASQPTLMAYVGVAAGIILSVAWFAWHLDGRSHPPKLPMRALACGLALVLATWDGHEIWLQARSLAAQPAWLTAEVLLHGGQPLSQFLSTTAKSAAWTQPRGDTAEFGRRVAALRQASPVFTAPADIVTFLQESQFNPATIDGCSRSLCDVDSFRPDSQNVRNGPLQVHVFGGGTWLSEFALLTGVPHQMFGAAGEFASFSVAPGTRRSFIRSLKAAGYRTVAVYPTRGGLMNGRGAYEGYGFDAFYDAAEVGLPGGFSTSDQEVHDAALKVLARERTHGQPVFLFVLTIFNHSEHGVHMERVPAGLQAQAAASFAAPSVARSVADYVWRTREFASVVGATRAAVLDAGRPAVFAWFGDHQPPFGNAIELRSRIRAVQTTGGEVPAKYQTWYQVSSNVSRFHAEARPTPLDIVFLPGLLAQAAGVPLDDWLAANVVARDGCGGLLQECRAPQIAGAYLSYLWYELRAFELP